jgi:trimeric autotransporter adhesin
MKRIFIIIFSTISIITNAQNIGIGVANPQNKLHVGGGFRLDTLTGVGGAGLVWHNPNGVVYGIKFSGNTNDVLRGDGTFGTYSVNGNIGWLLNGNSGTNPATHFIGTTDDQPLWFRMRNQPSGLVDSAFQSTRFGYRSGGNGWFNSSFGYKALFNAISGYFNNAAAFGSHALYSNTTGEGNNAFGCQALFTNAAGSSNNAFGFQALYYNTGNRNSAFGNFALTKNTFAGDNSAFGSSALSSNENGYFNTAAGSSAAYYNLAGHDLTAVGYHALYNNGKVRIDGVPSFGSFNTSVGAFSMEQNIGGEHNTAVGYKALQKSYGTANTAIGSGALQDGSGNANTALGKNALNGNLGDYNIGVGPQALYYNQFGNNNTAVGASALGNNSSGSANTAIGYQSGVWLPSGVSNVTCIGQGTGWATTSDNQVNIGNFSVSWIGGQTGWFHYSDKRIKNDIKDDVPGLAFITRLRPITYHVDLNKQEEIANSGKVSTNSELIKPIKNDWEGKYDVEKIKMTGFFAQDVEDAAKAINYSFNGVHNPKNGGLLSLDYSVFVVPLVKAVQEQQSIIDKQQKLIDELLKRVEALEKK